MRAAILLIACVIGASAGAASSQRQRERLDMTFVSSSPRHLGLLDLAVPWIDNASATPKAPVDPATTDPKPETLTRNQGCHTDCTKRGNCNLDLGRCECPIGWEGEACEVPLLGACRYDLSSIVSTCAQNYGRNCECFKQCRAFFCQNHGCTMHYEVASAPCFKYKGVPDHEQTSRIPEASDSSVEYFRGGKPVPAAEVLKIDRGAPLSPHASCPNNCNFQGVCVEGHCQCHFGYTGADCGEIDGSFCINKCNGRGKCVQGFCHCEAPWFGRDCSRNETHIGKILPPPRALTKIKIYVYDIPLT